MVVVDRFSKYATFIPVTTDCKVKEVARAFFKNVVKLWGIPRSIISDRDPIFMGKFWKELFRLLGTDLNFSTSFHPQSDGHTERVNALLELYLRNYMSATKKIGLDYWMWLNFPSICRKTNPLEEAPLRS